ncbi:uncharacterized protein LOC119589469 [Penaeus monodon]|uniref:uncharacterized protein LOC119589469 n=1 Tax=Penaeus monodon TaxID=6687 RepID=UPI0018A7AB28|nr:uncharacterized protein LOC119589469 [Penaeus monodon]
MSQEQFSLRRSLVSLPKAEPSGGASLTRRGGGGGRRQGSQRRPGHPPAHINCPQPEGFHGFLVDLIDLLSSEMNFTYTLYEVCDNNYGSRKGGNWTGVVGEVINGYAHIGLGNLGANYARSLAVSFPLCVHQLRRGRHHLQEAPGTEGRPSRRFPSSFLKEGVVLYRRLPARGRLRHPPCHATSLAPSPVSPCQAQAYVARPSDGARAVCKSSATSVHD